MSPVHCSAISHSRLMRESTDRIEIALRSDDVKEHLIAYRLSESSRTWELWENEHSGLMRQVAEYGDLPHEPRMLVLPQLPSPGALRQAVGNQVLFGIVA